jgi:PadR family transcriptional regulator, regulatory protein AphA
LSAKHALLGLLLQRSAYPYELADRLQGRLGPAWKVNSGQVYQTIKLMARDGLIERVDGTVESEEERHVYAITPSGMEEFDRWFDGATPTVRLSRRPLLVKITLAGPERLRDAIEQIDAYELSCAKRVAELMRMRDASRDTGVRVLADQVLLRLNLSADIAQLEGELRWARHARETVAWLLDQEAIWPAVQDRLGKTAARARQGARWEACEGASGERR